MAEASFFPILALLLHTPAQVFVVAAQVEACRMRSAVAGLRRFRLETARCHSDADHEELLKLIAKWFSSERTAHGERSLITHHSPLTAHHSSLITHHPRQMVLLGAHRR